MNKNNVIKFELPGEFTDQLTEILRQEAEPLIKQAGEAEFASFFNQQAHVKRVDGRRRSVRHGHLPERKVAAAIGSILVKVPYAWERQGHQQQEVIKFTSEILST